MICVGGWYSVDQTSIHGEWNWTPWFTITMNRAEFFLGQHLK